MPEEISFGPYTLVGKIATGGMGEVFLARAPEGMRPTFMALKILKEDLAHDSNFVEMLLDEAHISMNLDHPNVVACYDFGEIDGRYFMAMEYVAGISLYTILTRLKKRGRTLDVDLAIHSTLELCGALGYAHALTDESGEPLGIVHRDVTPANVLVSASGQLKLADFGVARARNKLHQTLAGTVKGKVGWMAPEMLRSEEIDGRADIFSTGVLLYLMLTGEHPAQDLDLVEAFLRYQRKLVPPPSTKIAAVPRKLDAIVMRALEPNPADRFETAEELADALRPFATAKPRELTARMAQLVDQLASDKAKAAAAAAPAPAPPAPAPPAPTARAPGAGPRRGASRTGRGGGGPRRESHPSPAGKDDRIRRISAGLRRRNSDPAERPRSDPPPRISLDIEIVTGDLPPAGDGGALEPRAVDSQPPTGARPMKQQTLANQRVPPPSKLVVPPDERETIAPPPAAWEGPAASLRDPDATVESTSAISDSVPPADDRPLIDDRPPLSEPVSGFGDAEATIGIDPDELPFGAGDDFATDDRTAEIMDPAQLASLMEPAVFTPPPAKPEPTRTADDRRPGGARPKPRDASRSGALDNRPTEVPPPLETEAPLVTPLGAGDVTSAEPRPVVGRRPRPRRGPTNPRSRR